MPEITDAEYRQFVRYQGLGTPDELERLPKKVADLESDNKAQRDEIRDLKAKLPADGAVALPKEKADALAAYEALGTPEEIGALKEKAGTLEQEIAKRDRQAARDAAAKALGIEGSDLASFAGADALTFEVREEEATEGGKTVKKPVAYVTDAEGKEHRLADYGKQTWGRPFEAVLSAPQPGAPAPQPGVPYTRQTPGNPSPPKQPGIVAVVGARDVRPSQVKHSQ